MNLGKITRKLRQQEMLAILRYVVHLYWFALVQRQQVQLRPGMSLVTDWRFHHGPGPRRRNFVVRHHQSRLLLALWGKEPENSGCETID